VGGGMKENWLLTQPPATYGDIGILSRVSTELCKTFVSFYTV